MLANRDIGHLILDDELCAFGLNNTVGDRAVHNRLAFRDRKCEGGNRCVTVRSYAFFQHICCAFCQPLDLAIACKGDRLAVFSQCDIGRTFNSNLTEIGCAFQSVACHGCTGQFLIVLIEKLLLDLNILLLNRSLFILDSQLHTVFRQCEILLDKIIAASRLKYFRDLIVLDSQNHTGVLQQRFRLLIASRSHCFTQGVVAVRQSCNIEGLACHQEILVPIHSDSDLRMFAVHFNIVEGGVPSSQCSLKAERHITGNSIAIFINLLDHEAQFRRGITNREGIGCTIIIVVTFFCIRFFLGFKTGHSGDNTVLNRKCRCAFVDCIQPTLVYKCIAGFGQRVGAVRKTADYGNRFTGCPLNTVKRIRTAQCNARSVLDDLGPVIGSKLRICQLQLCTGHFLLARDVSLGDLHRSTGCDSVVTIVPLTTVGEITCRCHPSMGCCSHVGFREFICYENDTSDTVECDMRSLIDVPNDLGMDVINFSIFIAISLVFSQDISFIIINFHFHFFKQNIFSVFEVHDDCLSGFLLKGQLSARKAGNSRRSLKLVSVHIDRCIISI